MSLRTIDCIGSDYPMGVLQGRLLKENIIQAWNEIQKSPHSEFYKPPLMPKQLYLLHCQKKADTFLKNYLNKFHPELSERVMGIAQGATLPSETVFFLQSYEMELMAKPDSFALGSGLQIGVPPQKSINHEPIIGMNWDYAWNLQPYMIVRNSKPRQGFHSVELTLSFLAGCLAGVNEHSLCLLATPTIANDAINLTSMPITLVIQKALETCKTADEAKDLIINQNRDSGYNVLIADRLKIYSLELSRTSNSCSEIINQIVIKGNHYTSSEMQNKQPDLSCTWTNKAHKNYIGKPLFSSNVKRLEVADKTFKNDLFDLDMMKEVFNHHSSEDSGLCQSVCCHSDIFNTQASIIITPASKTLYALAGYPCENYYKTYSVSPLR